MNWAAASPGEPSCGLHDSGLALFVRLLAAPRNCMMRLTAEEFDTLVVEALQEIPESFQAYMKDVVVETQQLPDPHTCRIARVRNPYSLLGLYHGLPLTMRNVENPRSPDRITIFQQNIERICRTREDVVHQVRKTVLHEVGHHFGLDESDLESLGFG